MLDFRAMLRLHYDVHLSYRDIARVPKTHHTTVSRWLARFEKWAAHGRWRTPSPVTIPVIKLSSTWHSSHGGPIFQSLVRSQTTQSQKIFHTVWNRLPATHGGVR